VATRYGCESSICAYNTFFCAHSINPTRTNIVLLSHVSVQHDRDQFCRNDGTSANISLTADVPVYFTVQVHLLLQVTVNVFNTIANLCLLASLLMLSVGW
jgi:hypothetical protein